MLLSQKLSRSLRISALDLRLGMFVAELDRPWEESPFLLQGFVLSDAADLDVLKNLVSEVVIDPTRSQTDALLHLPWEILHEPRRSEEFEQDENDVRTVYVSAPRKSTTRFQRFLANGFSFVSRRVRSSTSPVPTKSPIQKRPALKKPISVRASYLQYRPGSAEKSNEKEAKNTHQKRVRRPNEKHFPPPSTRKFTHLIRHLYPRDAMFAPLNMVERLLASREAKAADKTLVRGKNFRKRVFSFQRPKYIPKHIKLVVYKNDIPLTEELVHARQVIQKTDALLQKLAQEIHTDPSLALEEVRPTINLLTESVIANPSALMWLIRMKNESNKTYAHGLKVAVYMMTLGRHLGFSRHQLSELGFIGLLLDIGKLELPDELLAKAEKLSDEERALIQTHVAASLSLLNSGAPLGQNVLQGIGEHHERIDGTGYPNGLTGAEISIFGKISAIADSFSAMTSPRPYDITRSAFDAMKELFKIAGAELHAPLVEEFVQAIGIFPVGSMIELSSGEVAIVLEHNKIRRLEPKVLILTNADKSLLETPRLFDLMRQKIDDETRIKRIQRGLPDGAYGLVCRDFYRA
jgi:HD-GYP domain-containing protein (c-di-GMP phosphodiesterase class II)